MGLRVSGYLHQSSKLDTLKCLPDGLLVWICSGRWSLWWSYCFRRSAYPVPCLRLENPLHCWGTLLSSGVTLELTQNIGHSCGPVRYHCPILLTKQARIYIILQWTRKSIGIGAYEQTFQWRYWCNSQQRYVVMNPGPLYCKDWDTPLAHIWMAFKDWRVSGFCYFQLDSISIFDPNLVPDIYWGRDLSWT